MMRLFLFVGGTALAFYLVTGVPGQLSARGARGDLNTRDWLQRYRQIAQNQRGRRPSRQKGDSVSAGRS
jgi:hypothetical protein